MYFKTPTEDHNDHNIQCFGCRYLKSKQNTHPPWSTHSTVPLSDITFQLLQWAIYIFDYFDFLMYIVDYFLW